MAVLDRYDYLIVGSGLTGAVFAYEATRHGKSCLILERRNHTGGNLYTKLVEGISVHHYGPHIFHTSNQRIWEYVNGLVPFYPFINSPIANHCGEIYNLPFNMNTFTKMWGVSTPEQVSAIIKRQRAEIIGEPRNLEEQAISQVGRDIFEKLIKGYTEKQWGRPCNQLPAEIIKRIPVRLIYDNNYYDDRWQGIPIGGWQQLINKLLSGIEVRVLTDFLKDKAQYRQMAKRIIYTGMIDEYFDYCLSPLEYRGLRFESEVLDKPNYQGVAVVNYTDVETPYTRVIEHKHFAFGSQPNTVITKEYPVAWKLGDEAYYPIGDAKNQALYRKYLALAETEEDIFFCGRLAEYKYYDMDDAIASVLALADRQFAQE
jgi:UDP-galactopyranose mutase